MRRAQDAMEAGIETVYQDLALVDTMSAYQNVYLGREPLAKSPLLRLFNLVDDRTMRRRSREVLDALAVKIPSINVSVKGMSGGQRQCLAIARAILWGRRIVILDEPTAALGVRETAQVLDVIRDLRKHDVSVIVVSHNMQQLMEVADRITVMRLGRTIATRDGQGHRGLRDRRAHHRRDRRGPRGGDAAASLPRPEGNITTNANDHHGRKRHERHVTFFVSAPSPSWRRSAPVLGRLRDRRRAQDKFKLGMAVGGNPCCEWMKAQGDVARALAEQRGWDYIELSQQ